MGEWFQTFAAAVGLADVGTRGLAVAVQCSAREETPKQFHDEVADLLKDALELLEENRHLLGGQYRVFKFKYKRYHLTLSERKQKDIDAILRKIQSSPILSRIYQQKDLPYMNEAKMLLVEVQTFHQDVLRASQSVQSNDDDEDAFPDEAPTPRRNSLGLQQESTSPAGNAMLEVSFDSCSPSALEEGRVPPLHATGSGPALPTTQNQTSQSRIVPLQPLKMLASPLAGRPYIVTTGASHKPMHEHGTSNPGSYRRWIFLEGDGKLAWAQDQIEDFAGEDPYTSETTLWALNRQAEERFRTIPRSTDSAAAISVDGVISAPEQVSLGGR